MLCGHRLWCRCSAAVLKDADRAMKSEGPKRHDIRAMLKGAMTNAGNGKRRENFVSRR